MNGKDYFKGLKEYTDGFIPVTDKKSMHVLLYSPYMKKVKSFTLLLEGMYFFRIDAAPGAVLYEVLEHEAVSDSLALKQVISDATNKILGIMPKVNEVKLRDDVEIIFEELRTYALGTHKKNLLRKIYAHTYCDTYRRPVKIHLDLKNDSKMEDYKRNLALLRKNAIGYLSYKEEFIYKPDYKEYLLLAKGFYKEIEIKASMLTPKLCADLKQYGMDRVVVSVYSTDNEIEYRHSKMQYKDILSGIKQALGHDLSVTAVTEIGADNSDYMKVLSMLHPLGVQDFKISFSKDVKDKDLIVKRAYYYTNINEINLMLDSRNAVSEKTLKQMAVAPSFKDMGRNPFVMSEDGMLTSPKYKEPLGNLNSMDMELIYDLKYLKIFRKGKFKEEDYEKDK